MAKIYTADGVYIADVMLQHLNSWPKKPADVILEDIGKDAPSMMLQQLSAAEVRKTYVNGSYIGVWPFAVYIRINAEDTASRLDATGCLRELAKWLDEKDDRGTFIHLPIIDSEKTATRIQMTSSPSIVGRMEDGIEDYQALFELEYKHHRR